MRRVEAPAVFDGALGASVRGLLHDAAMSAPEEAAPAAKPAQELSGSQKRHLRSLAHHLEPVVRLGKEGVSAAVVSATDDALRTHELIKVRLPQTDRDARARMAEALRSGTRAHLAGMSGRVALLYRRHPEKPQIRLPR